MIFFNIYLYWRLKCQGLYLKILHRLNSFHFLHFKTHLQLTRQMHVKNKRTLFSLYLKIELLC